MIILKLVAVYPGGPLDSVFLVPRLSAITFMAIPATNLCHRLDLPDVEYDHIVGYSTDRFGVFTFFRRLQITTAYEYLELRFNLATRLIGSIMFILLQLGRIGIVLFLPSLALSVLTGISVEVCILLMGVLSILYTVLGGIEAVIWTDVIQVVVLLGGALFCLFLIPAGLEGGWGTFVETAESANKFSVFDWNFDWTTTTTWVILLGGIGANLISYGSDQTVVQRYLTTKNEDEAARSIWTNAILVVPATLLFFALGTALYVFYTHTPEALSMNLENGDAIFPFFIVTQLPDGLAGLLIAGIFAASMSSLDSSMNSVATVITIDFYKRFWPGSSETSRLNLARICTAIVGMLGVGFALLMATWNIKSLWDQLSIFIGLFAGGLGGIFLLGMLTKRTNGIGALIGLVSSAVIQFLIKHYTSVSFMLYTATGIVACLIIGYIASYLGPKTARPLEELTI